MISRSKLYQMFINTAIIQPIFCTSVQLHCLKNDQYISLVNRNESAIKSWHRFSICVIWQMSTFGLDSQLSIIQTFVQTVLTFSTAYLPMSPHVVSLHHPLAARTSTVSLSYNKMYSICLLATYNHYNHINFTQIIISRTALAKNRKWPLDKSRDWSTYEI